MISLHVVLYPVSSACHTFMFNKIGILNILNKVDTEEEEEEEEDKEDSPAPTDSVCVEFMYKYNIKYRVQGVKKGLR